MMTEIPVADRRPDHPREDSVSRSCGSAAGGVIADYTYSAAIIRFNRLQRRYERRDDLIARSSTRPTGSSPFAV